MHRSRESQSCSAGKRARDLHVARQHTAGLSVLHYDADYDRIAAVTNQPAEWIAPAGTLD